MTRRRHHTKTLTLAAMAIFASALAVSAATPDPDAEVFGSWIVLDVEQAGMHMRSTFTIHKDSIEVTSRCSYGDKQVEAKTSSPARVTDSEIQVTETRSVEREYSPGFLQCKANINAMTVAYTVKGDKLVLTVPDSGESHELSRASGT